MAKRHPLQDLLSPLLLPLSFVYGWAGALRRRRKKGRGWKPAAPCVSVGNISWGGTGKTPVIDWLLSWAEAHDLHAAVLTRGYGARPPHPAYRVNGLSSPADCGDEPLMLAQKHPHATIVVDPIRRRAGQSLAPSPSLFLLDDGFQHLAVERDLDLVLLDQDDIRLSCREGHEPSNWNRILPAGSWREPVSALRHAGAFLLKCEEKDWPELVPALKARLAGYARPVFAFRLAPEHLRPVNDAARNLLEAVDLPPSSEKSDGYRVPEAAALPDYAFVSGIGDPAQAMQTVTRALGHAPENVLTFPDHHDFSQEAAKLDALALPVVCTAKDAVKLARLPLTVPCFALDVTACFFASLSTEELEGRAGASPGFPEWWEAWWERRVQRSTPAASARKNEYDSILL